MRIALASLFLTFQTPPPLPLGTELVKIVATALLGCLFGAITAYITAELKLRELRRTFDLKVREMQTQFDLQREADRKKEGAKLREKYLSPLLFATNELIGRLDAVKKKLEDPAECKLMLGWFDEIERRRGGGLVFEYWCNDIGHFAVTTLFISGTYFAYANRILMEAPFHEVDVEYSTKLGARLADVRESLSFLDGVWRESQESVGRLMTKDSRVISYKELCGLLADASSFNWFVILLNFYRKLNASKKPRIEGIMERLSKLRLFLDQ